MVTSALSINSATAKLTVSIKRRLGNGDEVFLAPGIELSCAPDELDAKQAEVTERVHGWVENLLALYPDPTDDAEDDAEDADEDDAEDDAEDADEDGDEDEDGLSEEDIDAMDKKGLQALIKEHELEIEGAAKMAVKALREAVKEALFADEDGDEDEDEDADEDADEDDDGDEDSAGYTDEELKAMKLEELQEICKEWDIGTPKLAKGADLKAKKAAYIKHVKAAQEAEE